MASPHHAERATLSDRADDTSAQVAADRRGKLRVAARRLRHADQADLARPDHPSRGAVDLCRRSGLADTANRSPTLPRKARQESVNCRLSSMFAQIDQKQPSGVDQAFLGGFITFRNVLGRYGHWLDTAP
jgi:hypothetical protein